MKVHVLRLVEGNDLRDGIEQYCKDHNIGSACVLTCVGCVKELKLRMAGGKSFLHQIKDYEIVSYCGFMLHLSGQQPIALHLFAIEFCFSEEFCVYISFVTFFSLVL